MVKTKLLPHFIGLAGAVMTMTGFILASIYGNHVIFNIMVVLGFLIFGCAGVIMIIRMHYSMGFLEVKGILPVVYGSIILCIGVAGAIFFGILMFR